MNERKKKKKNKEWTYKITLSLWNGVVNCMINGFLLIGY